VNATTTHRTRRNRRGTRSGSGTMKFVSHPSLMRPNAEQRYLVPEINELVAQQGRLSTPDEIKLFQAFHMCGYLANRDKKTNAGRETKRYRELADLRQRIRERLVDANLGLVYELVGRNRFTNVDNDELVSDGLYALLQAVDAFNPWRGFRFSTYACNAILRAFIRHSMAESRHRQTAPVSFDPDMDQGSNVQDLRDNAQALYTERLAGLLDGNDLDMNETELFVLSRRFPSDPGRKRQTLEQIGRDIHVSKERVRQIQNGALVKLRSAMEADPILR
jgi:RNA polymerase sigma factor (sigma-70 family)